MLTRKLLFAVLFAMAMTASVVQAGGDPARGGTLALDCADCHGEDGKGDEEVPSIAGMDPAEHVTQLQAFKSGERTDEDESMLPYVEELSEQDMADLAAYYATLEAN